MDVMIPLKERLLKASNNGDYEEIKKMLAKKQRSERQEVLNSFEYKYFMESYRCVLKSPLLIACGKGDLEMVNLFLDFCGAEVEPPVRYDKKGNLIRHQISPMVVAASRHNLEILETLIKHGGNLNGLANVEKVPLLAILEKPASRASAVETIAYFVKQEHFNVNRKDNAGRTALMLSAGRTDQIVFKSLLQSGADINIMDKQGQSAIHYAIKELRSRTVKLILKNTSFRVELVKDTLLTTTALVNSESESEVIDKKKKIMSIITENVDYDYAAIINAMELLGAVDKKIDIIKEALRRRCEDSENPILKSIPDLPRDVYGHVHEPRNIIEFDSWKNNSSDDHSEEILHLLILERILGTANCLTMSRLKDFAREVYYENDLPRALKILDHTIMPCFESGLILSTYYLLRVLVRVMKYIHYWLEDKKVLPANITRVQLFEVPLRVLHGFATTAEKFHVNSSKHNSTKCEICECHKGIRVIRSILRILAITIEFNDLLQSSGYPSDSSKEIAKVVVRLSLLGAGCGSLVFQSAIDWTNTVYFEVEEDEEEEDTHIIAIPNTNLLQFLLDNGYQYMLNETDSEGNTPLLFFACQSYNLIEGPPDSEFRWSISTQDMDEVMSFLLMKGAHPDACNVKGATFYDYIPSESSLHTYRKKLCLQCLAAKAVVYHGITYRAMLPTIQKDLVIMHDPQKEMVGHSVYFRTARELSHR